MASALRVTRQVAAGPPRRNFSSFSSFTNPRAALPLNGRLPSSGVPRASRVVTMPKAPGSVRAVGQRSPSGNTEMPEHLHATSYEKPNEPAKVRDAASVMVIRDSKKGPGIELFWVRRHKRSSFMGDVTVFPGGKVDQADRDLCAKLKTSYLHHTASELCPFVQAAAREAFEEAAFLNTTTTIRHEEVAALRQGEKETIEASKATKNSEWFSQMLRKEGLVLDLSSIVACGHWVTPVIEPMRFNTHFFMMPATGMQEGEHCNDETSSGLWLSPEEALEEYHAKKIILAPPQIWFCELLQGAQTVQEALSLAEAMPRWSITPDYTIDKETGLHTVRLPGDKEFGSAFPEWARSSLAVPTRYVKEKGSTWQNQTVPLE